MRTYLQYSALISLSVLLTIGAGCSNEKSNVNSTAPTSNTTEVSNEQDTVEITDDETTDTTQTDTTVVTTDVYGEDISTAPRYPNSIRSYYSQNELETAVTYQTTGSQEDIRKYYKDTLTKDTWTVSEEATDYVEFSRGDENNPEYLTVYLTSYKNVLEYELVYEPPYTEEQLKQLESDEESAEVETNL